MKTLDLKKGFQGQVTALDSIVDAVVNDDGLQPSLHLDFEAVGQLAYAEQNGERQYQRTMQLLDAVCARDSGGTNIEWDFSNGGVVGALTEVGKNGLRWNSVAGLFQEASSTNQIRNPRCEGAVAGTPGTLPDNYQLFANGTTVTVVGSGYENGWPYFECRLNGTPTQDPFVDFEANSIVSANNAEDWTTSLGVRVTAGDLTNISGVQLGLRQGGASDAFLSLLAGPDVTPTSEHKRFFHSSTTNNASIQFIRNRLTINWDGSGAIDITLRIYAPQLEQASAPSSPILPAIGTPAASTRATETVTSLASVTRASRKSNAGEWDFTNGGAVGAYREYLPNVPAVTGKGLLVEEASTNHIRNPRGEGAVAGTPGTLPTNWVVSGLTQEVVGSGYENGHPYVDIRFNGTPTSDFRIQPESIGQVVASTSQDWTVSIGLKIVGGSLTNIANMRLEVWQRNGSNTLLSVGSGQSLMPDASHKRYLATQEADQATVASVQPNLEFDWDGSGAVDITLRIYAPQLEQKAYPTSIILPPKGTLAARTRAADDIQVAKGSWLSDLASGGTLYVSFQPASLNNGPTWVAALTDTTSVADSVALRGYSNHDVVVRDGGLVEVDTVGLKTLSVGVEARTALAFADADFAVSSDGEAQQTDTNCTMPALSDIDALVIGNRGGSVPYWNGYIKQIRYFPIRETNAEIETLAGNS